MPSKQQFMGTYRSMLMDTPEYEWAHDADRLERFMSSVRNTLFTQANTWNIDSPVVGRAWKKIGLKGRPSYKGLRALSDETAGNQ